MCDAPEQGGKRCAKHTRPRYEALVAAMDAKARGAVFGKDSARSDVRRTFTMDGENATNIIANHASTPAGAKQIAADIERYQSPTEADKKTVMVLRNALRLGADRLEVVKEVKQSMVKAERAANNSMAELVETKNAYADTLAGRYPELASMWITEKNKGLPPHKVAAKSNAGVWLRCPSGHEMYNRLNNWANGLDAGRRPYCEGCQPRRAAAFKSTQQDLTSLLGALSNNASAFHTLSPALQYAVMEQVGMLRGGKESMGQQVAMSIVHGDLTLAEVMRAETLSNVEKKVRDNLDDDDALSIISDVDIKAATKTKAPEATLEKVFAAAGVLSVCDAGSEVAESVLRESLEQMWKFACAPAASKDPDAYAEYLTGWVGKNDYPNAQVVLTRFLDEFDAVRAMPVPANYEPTRRDEHGATLRLEPTLAQRRFAFLVNTRRRFLNLSGTGAGKTLATTLAVQSSHATETLVVCPLAVVGQWMEEFRQGFPTSTEVREGLPTADAAAPREGVNRVWVVNYDQFQGDTKALHAILDPFAERVDAIVFDEVHLAKESTKCEESRRRKALLRLTDRAGAANSNLIVIGASATPVVNDLNEAKSLLRLVEGPGGGAYFLTKPTIRNAAVAYRRITSVAVRHLPDYPTRLDRENLMVDITGRVGEVFGRLQRSRRGSEHGRITPLAMEQALLPVKMPTIIEKVKTNAGPTLVYTEFVDGIVAPMREEMEAEGLRVGVYTGKESPKARRAVLSAFRNGDLDVLIGSKPLSTGVDGLQRSSHHLIVASMPWTAACDDQLVGRLYRHGQSDNVTVSYVLAHAKVGKIDWSYCKDHRQRRIHFKRDIANAAVDGILPDGALEETTNSVEHAFGMLSKMMAPTAA